MTAVTVPEIVSFSSKAFCRPDQSFGRSTRISESWIVTFLIAAVDADMNHVARLDGDRTLFVAQQPRRA